jgi:hypothetical protein
MNETTRRRILAFESLEQTSIFDNKDICGRLYHSTWLTAEYFDSKDKQVAKDSDMKKKTKEPNNSTTSKN